MSHVNALERFGFNDNEFQDLDAMLTMEQIHKGYRLRWFKRYEEDDDEFVKATILFKAEHGVYYWIDPPTMGMVWDKVNELEAAHV